MNDDYINIPLTLERHLKAFSEHKDHTERHQILWTTWCQNKRWLSHLLEYVLTSFPTFSLHDATHAESVIHNMELILGEERIKSLSASDTFMLLHIAYVHDIGMCITDADKKEIIKSDFFLTLIEKAKTSSDAKVRSYASKMDYLSNKGTTSNDSLTRDEFFEEKLDIYKAVLYFLSEYRRPEHGEVSKERLKSFIFSDEALGKGFSTSEVPARIFYQIAECAATHTIWGFEAILSLAKENNGYAHDFIHPRFVAVLLQVADALDMENGRFHILTHAFNGELNDVSEMHFEKHQSIRQLTITDKIISITADCERQEVIRLIRNECNYLESLLKNANYHWSEIAPKNFKGCLPTLLAPTLLHKGKRIPQELINAKFNLSTEKSFRLIEGINVYNDSFPYVREIIQNAIDATKIQLWDDYVGSSPKIENIFKEYDSSNFSILPDKIKKMLPKYQIEVELEIVAIDISTNEHIEYDKIPENFQVSDNSFAVLVSIQDHGIGISADDLISISNVGTSHSAQNPHLKNMPAVLQTTGKFGIGLQSIFQITNTFTAKTRTHSGESYNITFSSGSGSSSGVINTMNLDDSEKIPFGTQVSFVVPVSQRIEKQCSQETWRGENPFSDSYEGQKNLKEAEELLSQIVHYLNDLFGQILFPVVVVAKNMFSDRECVPLNGKKNIILRSETKESKCDEISVAELINNISWAFQIDKMNEYPIRNDLPGGDYYVFDTENVALLLWSAKWQTLASISAERLYNQFQSAQNHSSIKNKSTNIFYKGIATRFNFKPDESLLLVDYLDIKSSDAEKILMLNRENLTKEGKNYVKSIYNAIADLLTEVYADIANKFVLMEESSYQNNQGEQIEQSANDKLEKDDFLPVIVKDHKKDGPENNGAYTSKLIKAIIKFSILAFHASLTLRAKNKEAQCSVENSAECPWSCLLKDMIDICATISAEDLSFPTYNMIGTSLNNAFSKKESLPNILYNINSFGIMSYHDEHSHIWQHKIYRINLYEMIVGTVSDKQYDKIFQNEITSRMREQYNYLRGISPNIIDPYSQNSFATEILIDWLLHNTPTIALHSFFDIDAEKDSSAIQVRFNILSKEKSQSIHIDDHSLFLIMKKIQERATSSYGKVFSTIAFDDCQCLTIGDDQFPEDICHINCGILPQGMAPKMLLPFEFDFVSNFFENNNITLKANTALKEQFKKGLQEPMDILQKWQIKIRNSQILVDELTTKHNAVKEEYESRLNPIDFEQFLSKFEKSKGDFDDFLQMIFDFRNLEDKPEKADEAKTYLDKIINDPSFDLLAECFFWIREYALASYLKKVVPTRELLNKFIVEWRELPETKKMIAFTVENAESELSSHRYRELYENLFKKLYNCIAPVLESDFKESLKTE